jgi:hypothetical protein
MDLKIGSAFDDIPSAKLAIKAYLTDAAESWKVTYSDKSRFCIICKQNDSCNFRIRTIRSKKKGISITYIEPYTCSLATYYSVSNTNLLEYLILHYRFIIINNLKISLNQIQSNERLCFFNKILYL